jgi:dTDP-4-amino-4,6-dideoxygalactose transaminase
MTSPIQLFVPVFRVEETLEEIRECLIKGWTGLGFKTVSFEQAWREYTGIAHAHFVNSATAGLHLAIRLLKEADHWKDGDEVITTPLTFVSTNHVILYEKLTPVFADVDEHLCLDPKSVTERISPCTRAVMFVGIGGNSGRLGQIARLCAQRNLRLILDASHMAGTRIDGHHVGNEADVAVFSFQAVKNLPTADSGMVCFREEAMDSDVRKWTWLGIDRDTYSRTIGQSSYKWKYDVVHEGFKYHGNSITAAMGLVALRYLDQDNAYRRQIASWYDKHFENCPGIATIPVANGCESSRHLYQIMVENRDQVMLALNSQQIYPGVHYQVNTQYTMYGEGRDFCPRAAACSERLISLPMHLRLSHQDVDRISRAVIELVQRSTRVASV